MRVIVLLIALLLAVPAQAQVAQGSKPANENVAADMVQCAMFYTISANCIQTLAKQETPQTQAARQTSNNLLKLAKQVYRKGGMAPDAATAKMTEVGNMNQAQMSAEAGPKCSTLDSFMDKYGERCVSIAKSPGAYMDDKLGNLP